MDAYVIPRAAMGATGLLVDHVGNAILNSQDAMWCAARVLPQIPLAKLISRWLDRRRRCLRKTSWSNSDHRMAPLLVDILFTCAPDLPVQSNLR
ncbi:hypothetical protein WT83_27800 [Burkholderia territorii]|uniref:Uncharacterized protein n=1 Tax=Burkholderia territorii TaxID=1503055 RepID=A0A108E746_9BURK|nr:hypothetical protein WT83_27800 [Burkholderia territorii]